MRAGTPAARAVKGTRLRGRGAFSLIEIMAVVLLTATVLIAAVNIYLPLAPSTAEAADATRTQRRAVLILDRIARDLEGTVLLTRPEEVDPLSWPWLFLAEATPGRDAADRLKLDARSFLRAEEEGEHGDLAVVSWWLAPGEGDALQLLRASRPTLPEGLDRSFPRRDDPGVRVVADDVVRFGIRFLDEEGGWVEAWDSSTLAFSNRLPQAAEIALALLPEDLERPADEARVHLRRVRLPLRPLDLAALREGGDGEAEGEEDEEEEDGDEQTACVTVAQCRAQNPQAFDAFLSSRPDPAAAAAVLESLSGQCFSDAAGSLGIQVEGCQ